MDWEGLLKFTLKHSDGTKKSEFSQMKNEDKEFLEGALNEYCNSQLTRIKQILQKLDEPEEEDEEERLDLLEELQELLDSLDKGNTLYKLGGHLPILKIIFYSKFISNRIVALQIFSSINQNDAVIQTDSINNGALELVLLVKSEQNMRLKENMMSAISAMIRGENLEAKRIFVRIKGLELLEFLMTNSPSERLLNKVNTLWRDLTYYDQFLHLTFKDLSAFSNTSNLKLEKKENHNIDYDPNKEMQEKNQLPANAQYKGCIQKFLHEHEEVGEMHRKWLTKQKELEGDC